MSVDGWMFKQKDALEKRKGWGRFQEVFFFLLFVSMQGKSALPQVFPKQIEILKKSNTKKNTPPR